MKKALLVFGFAFLAFIAACAGPQPTREQFNSADFGAYPSDFQAIIKQYYSVRLFDPYSAVYTFREPVKGWISWGPSLLGPPEGIAYGYAVCGTLNAKNRMGGYVGVEPFFFFIRNDQVLRQWDGYPMASDHCGRYYGN